LTGKDLIESTLRLIGALASSEPGTGQELQDGLVTLNAMIGSFRTQNLLLWAKGGRTLVPTTLKAAYTIGNPTGGPAGDFAITRPTRVDRIDVQVLSNPLQPLEIELEMLNTDQWADIPVKNISSPIPQKVYYDDQFPLAIMNLYPVPSVAVNYVMYSWGVFTSFPDLTTDITFPDGYDELLRYNLAIRLAPEYNRQTAPEVALLAKAAIANIKSINITPIYSRCDDALLSMGGHYDWRSDTYRK
jgi:hypothetical protein